MRMLRYVSLVMIILILSACGNRDTETYEITLNEGIDTVNVNGTWIDAGAKISVNEAEVTAQTNDSVDTSQMGLYEVEYTATFEGVEYTIIRYVIVTDIEPPVVSLYPGVDTVYQYETWTDSGVSVNDNTDTEPVITVTGTVDTTVVGTYFIEYMVEDDYGNVSYITRVVTVIE